MPPSPFAVRSAAEADVPALAGTLAAAFRAYPWTTWAVAAVGAYLSETGLGAVIGDLLGDRMAALEEVEERLAPHRPAEAHWTLQAVGVAPERQGAGLGTALLGPMLARCDADGRAASLETSSPANVRRYERLGFAVVHELAAGAAPRVWLMVRAPR